MARSFSRSPLLLAAGMVVAALGLTGCSVEDFKAVEVTVPDELIAPGTKVAVGETVRVPGKATTDPSSGFSDNVELGLTVTAIDYPGEYLFKKYGNGSDFSGYDPVTVAYQLDAPEGAKLFKLQAGEPFGNLTNGKSASQLSAKDVGDNIDEACYRGTLPSDSSTKRKCTVLLVPKGQSLDIIGWDGRWTVPFTNALTDVFPGDPRFPYVEKAITFTIPKKDDK